MFAVRSYLFAPANNEVLSRKVFLAGADAVVLDLEDAVLPNRKAVARELLAKTLQEVTESAVQIFVRINPVSGSEWRADVEAAVTPATHGVRMAKAESVSEIQAVDEAISAAERRLEIRAGSIAIVPTIETANGVLNCLEMAKRPRVSGFCLGASDLLNDIAGELDETAMALWYAQSHLVLVSRSSGLLPPVASVHTELGDLVGLKKTTEQYHRMGFFGRSCIHPSQLSVVHEVFTPSKERIERARSIVAAYENAAATGSGTSQTSEKHFVDAATVAQARKILFSSNTNPFPKGPRG